MEEKARILIVDDDKSLSKSLSLVLEKKGYCTQWARTGKEALAKAKESAFNIALIDLRLPDTSGVELVEPLKKLNPNTALLIVTGYASLDTSVQAVDKRVSAYLIKPLNMDELLQRVEDILTRQGLIEEKRQAEQALRQKTEQQEILLSSIPAFIYFKDSALKLVAANKAFAEMVHTPIDQLPCKDAYDLFPKEQSKKFHSDDRKVMESGTPMMDIEEEFTDAEGKTRWASSSKIPYFEESGEVAGVVGIAIDITERKQAEEALKDSEERYRGLFENSSEFLFTLDLKGNFTNVNKAAVELTGHIKSELLQMNFKDYTPRNNHRRLFRAFYDVFKTGKPLRDFPVKAIVKDKTEKYFETSLSPLKKGDEIIGFQGSSKDITEQRRAQEAEKLLRAQLYQSQKLESIGTLASGIAHEINNPLMGIINYAQLIHDRIQDDKLKEFSHGIIKEGNRVGTIVKNLLSFARQEKETHSPAYISDIIEASLSLIGAVLRKDQITIEQDIPDDLPKIKCRSQQIEQVMLNLLTNARDALNKRYEGYHENKVVRISVRPFEREGEKWIRTTVEDHGTGIPQDVSNRVFDPFYSTKPREEGTGLGLSVSYGIVKEHRGELVVESKLGDYTRFHIDLRVDNEWFVRSGASGLSPDDSGEKDGTYDGQGSDSQRKMAP